MRVCIVHQNATPSSDHGYPRHFFLGRELVKRGHEVTVVASAFGHKTGRSRLAPGESVRRETHDGIDFVWLRTPGYRGNGAARLKDMLAFVRRVLALTPAALPNRPDLVLGSSPPPFAAWAALILARRFRVPFVLEVRDPWPQVLVEVGGMSRWHPLIVTMARIERLLCRRADAIVSASRYATPHYVSRGAEAQAVHWVPQGVDAASLPAPAPPPARDEFLLAYAGAHGMANGLDALLDAAAILQHDPATRRAKLRLIGDGPEKPRLMRRAAEEGIRNVVFDEPVPNADIHTVLTEADACVINVRNLPLYTWWASWQKIGDYMAAGRPVVIASSAYDNPVRDAQSGITVAGDDAAGLAGSVKALMALTPTERWEMGLRGRRHIEENYAFAQLAERLETVLLSVRQAGRRAAESAPSLPSRHMAQTAARLPEADR